MAMALCAPEDGRTADRRHSPPRRYRASGLTAQAPLGAEMLRCRHFTFRSAAPRAPAHHRFLAPATSMSLGQKALLDKALEGSTARTVSTGTIGTAVLAAGRFLDGGARAGVRAADRGGPGRDAVAPLGAAMMGLLAEARGRVHGRERPRRAPFPSRRVAGSNWGGRKPEEPAAAGGPGRARRRQTRWPTEAAQRERGRWGHGVLRGHVQGRQHRHRLRGRHRSGRGRATGYPGDRRRPAPGGQG